MEANEVREKVDEQTSQKALSMNLSSIWPIIAQHQGKVFLEDDSRFEIAVTSELTNNFLAKR